MANRSHDRCQDSSETLAADPQFRERFEREAKTISQLNHPHICTLHDVGDATIPSADPDATQRVKFLVMELLAASGRFLLYRSTDARTGDDIWLGALNLGRNTYVVSSDGQRFLLNTPVEQTGTSMTVVLDWLSRVK